MKAYEVMLILDPKLSEEEHAAVLEKVQGVIKDAKGAVDSVEAWGKRRLAFQIENLDEGDYTVIQFKAPADAIAELDRVLHITDSVVRFMIVRRDDLE